MIPFVSCASDFCCLWTVLRIGSSREVFEVAISYRTPLATPTMTKFPVSEGEVVWEAPNAGKPCKTWFKILGDLGSTSDPVLIALHGGPGAGHEYLVPLADLYKPYGISTVLYDQIGCGRSTHLREKIGDAEFWSFDLFIKELDTLIDHLNLRDRGFFLLGQSWGGVLAASYAMHQPQGKTPTGLRKLVISSGPSSIPLYGKTNTSSCARFAFSGELWSKMLL